MWQFVMTAQDMGLIVKVVIQIFKQLLNMFRVCQVTWLFNCHFRCTNSLQIPVTLDFSTIMWMKPKTWQSHRTIVASVLKQYAFHLLCFSCLFHMKKDLPQLISRPPALFFNPDVKQRNCLLIEITGVLQLAIFDISFLYTATQRYRMHVRPSNHFHEGGHVTLKIDVWQRKAKKESLINTTRSQYILL